MTRRRRALAIATALKGQTARNGRASHTCRCAAVRRTSRPWPCLWWDADCAARVAPQGRFSGRLETKSDEKRLAEECKLLGPLLGGVGKRGEKSRLTLAKIVRGIASGEVRRYCEAREAELQVAAGCPIFHRPTAVALTNLITGALAPIPAVCLGKGLRARLDADDRQQDGGATRSDAPAAPALAAGGIAAAAPGTSGLITSAVRPLAPLGSSPGLQMGAAPVPAPRAPDQARVALQAGCSKISPSSPFVSLSAYSVRPRSHEGYRADWSPIGP